MSDILSTYRLGKIFSNTVAAYKFFFVCINYASTRKIWQSKN